jgi:hypothetical protein
MKVRLESKMKAAKSGKARSSSTTNVGEAALDCLLASELHNMIQSLAIPRYLISSLGHAYSDGFVMGRFTSLTVVDMDFTC